MRYGVAPCASRGARQVHGNFGPSLAWLGAASLARNPPAIGTNPNQPVRRASSSTSRLLDELLDTRPSGRAFFCGVLFLNLRCSS